MRLACLAVRSCDLPADEGGSKAVLACLQAKYTMEELSVGQKVTGTVKSVHDFGVFVDIGAPRDALLNTDRFAVSALPAAGLMNLPCLVSLENASPLIPPLALDGGCSHEQERCCLQHCSRACAGCHVSSQHHTCCSELRSLGAVGSAASSAASVQLAQLQARNACVALPCQHVGREVHSQGQHSSAALYATFCMLCWAHSVVSKAMLAVLVQCPTSSYTDRCCSRA